MSSNSDSEDSDFVPDLEQDCSEDSVHSESEEEENENNSDESEKKTIKWKGVIKKQKSIKSKSKRKRRASSDAEDDKSDLNREGTSKKQITELSEEERKSKLDSLWNNFLSDVAAPSKNSSSTTSTQCLTIDSKRQISTKRNSSCEEETVNEKETTEVVDKKLVTEVPKEKEATTSSAIPALSEKKSLKQLPTNILRSGVKKSGGISSILSSISKKPKMSVLEKSKLDWTEFKQQNNLNEEITTFNRGKNGYLERQDFLQRTDSRQFEVEKEMRNKNRKKV